MLPVLITQYLEIWMSFAFALSSLDARPGKAGTQQRSPENALNKSQYRNHDHANSDDRQPCFGR